jgi:hypothetical protein
MNFRNFFRTVLALCAFATAAQASATAVLQVNADGILTGAKGVSVGGTLYDVRFFDGTCAQAYGSCTVASFNFKTEETATAAAQALLDQVYIDGPDGNFDTITTTTLGCTYFSVCQSFIPFRTWSVTYEGILANNFDGTNSPKYGHYDMVNNSGGIPYLLNTVNEVSGNFAIFEPEANVPEPSSIALMALAIAGIAFTHRRKA